MAEEYEKEIKCPYCQYVFPESWEFSDDDDDVDCESCDKSFSLTVEHETTYSTYKKPCESGHNWGESERYGPYSRHEGKYLHRVECKNCDESEMSSYLSDGVEPKWKEETPQAKGGSDE